MSSKARNLSDFISDPAIDSTELGDASVTTAKLSDQSVTPAKLHNTLDLSSKTVTLATDGISGNSVHGGVISDFASTGIDDNASATVITIDSSGRVGIGTGSPSASLDVQSNLSSGPIASFKQNNTSNPGYVRVDSPSDSSSRPSYLEGFAGGNRRWFIGEPYNASERPLVITGGGVNASNDANFSSGDLFLSINPNRGHVGIGSKTPSVYGGGLGTKNGLVLFNNTENGTGIRFDNYNASSSWEIWANGSSRLNIDSMNSGRDIGLMDGKIIIRQSSTKPILFTRASNTVGVSSRAQYLTCRNTITSSGTWYNVCFVSHSPALRVEGMATENDSAALGGGRIIGGIEGTYGQVGFYTDRKRVSAMNGGTISDFEYRYTNSNPNYTLQVRLTYSGSGPFYVYTHVHGLAVDEIYEHN